METQNNVVSSLSETIMKLDAIAANACKPGCECSKNEGSMCDDRARALKASMQAVRHIQSGEKTDFSDAGPQELSVLVLATARMRKIGDHPNVSRLDILLRNNSPRATRLARLWTADKLSFEYLLDAVSPRRFHGA
jgi:hypothetical protein